jgi:hypothetical protein
MLRIALKIGAAAVLLVSAGCQMCCHPNDYSGPVYDGPNGERSSMTHRAGSILSDGPAATTTSSSDVARRSTNNDKKVVVAKSSSQKQTQLKKQRDIAQKDDAAPNDLAQGMEGLVSTTDHAAKPAVAPSVSSREITTPEAPQPLSENGWTTARHSTTDMTQ